MELGHNGTRTQRDRDTMVLGHKGTGHIGIGTQFDLDTMGPEHNGIWTH